MMNYIEILNSSVARAISVHLKPQEGRGTGSCVFRKGNYHHLTNIHLLTSSDSPMRLVYNFL